ncbi:cystatin-A5-like [Trematomus bernacchii]|uniref:cystatin-A5-like n=1 Tax=Trematomus bernacchii TaxID=40690 RepID=UPI00146C67C1|nr:cystatin-A5-like [Trematomus bernacchii]
MASQDNSGWSPPEDATDSTQKICAPVKLQVEIETSQNYGVYKAVQYRKQMMGRKNFTIKVSVGGESYIHLGVFQQLPGDGGKVELVNIEVGKTKDDPLGTF